MPAPTSLSQTHWCPSPVLRILQGRRFFAICLFIALLCATSCTPVLAHSAGQMGVAPDQYDKGIPVFWPYHAGLMSAGFALLISGFMVMRFRKSPDRFRIHRILQTTGGGSILAGLSVGIFMVSLSGAPHIRDNHDILGAGILGLIALTLAIGYVVNRRNAAPSGLTPTHRWVGRTSIALAGLNILLGISMMAAVLAQ
jgi:hypothetical protein